MRERHRDSRRSRSRSYRRSRRSRSYSDKRRDRSRSRNRRYRRDNSDFRSETSSRHFEDNVNLDSDKVDYDFSEGEELEPINTLYAKRLMLVDAMCDLGLQPVEVEEQTAFGSRERVNLVHLPAAEGFPKMLQNYMEEAKGSRGTHRARFEPKLPLDMGRFPLRVRPNPKAIVVEDQPWLNAASQANTSLISSQGSSQGLTVSATPKIVVDQDKLRSWESSAREEFTMSSYNTWFLKAARTGIEALQQKVSDIGEAGRVTKSDWESIGKSLENVAGLIDSAGVGTKKIAENTVSDMGSMLLMRRDSWLKKLSEEKQITKQDMWDLRHSDINEQSLFSQIELDRIQDSAMARDSNTMTKKLIENLMAKNQLGGFKQSFRGGPSGLSRTTGSSGKKGDTSAGAGRGRGRGRGGRGGKRGSFKTDFPKKTMEFQPSKDK